MKFRKPMTNSEKKHFKDSLIKDWQKKYPEELYRKKIFEGVFLSIFSSNKTCSATWGAIFIVEIIV